MIKIEVVKTLLYVKINFFFLEVFEPTEAKGNLNFALAI